MYKPRKTHVVVNALSRLLDSTKQLVQKAKPFTLKNGELYRMG
jgi:hypothetical protein